MSDLRKRKLREDTPSHVNVRSRVLKQPRRLKRFFILLVLIAICVTYFLGLFAGQTQWFDGLAKSLGYESEYHYAVVIDAGSSGSRVLAYKFRVPFTIFGPSSLEVIAEHWKESKPGLSSYVDDPVKGADSIVQLINSAGGLVPASRRPDTALLVRATAGLRLLPPTSARILLDHVNKAVHELNYSVGANSVDIMEGSEEGIFSWYTVNLLHDLISTNPMVTLDLGGGSTQITFKVEEEERDKLPAEDLYEVPAGGDNITLYTHSYLRMGLLAARFGVFKLTAINDSTEFTSVCVDPIVQREAWVYANKEYIVSGAPRPKDMKREAVYTRCRVAVQRHLAATMGAHPPPPPRPPPPLKPALAAMSFFYDVAADAGMIDVMRGGTVTPGQYRAAAVTACSSSNVEQPWACIDLVYITSLLQDGYKMADNDPISLYKKINGHEVSWGLGLAYTTVLNKVVAAAQTKS